MLLTKANRKALPALYATEELDEGAATYPVKFFTPWSSWTWYAREFDGEDLFFGFAVNDAHPEGAELGYFSLNELKSIKGPHGLKIERDMHWSPKTLPEIKAGHRGMV
jgi:hypothetical protein